MSEKIFFWLIGFIFYCLFTFIILRILKRKIKAGENSVFWDALAGKPSAAPELDDPFGLYAAEREEYERNLELNIIFRSLVLFFILSFAYFYSGFEFRSFGIDLSQINEKTQELKVHRGKDSFIFKADREVSATVKILGVQVDPFKKDLG